jgi:hypothetical protein
MPKKTQMPSTSGILIQPKRQQPSREHLMYAAGFTDGEGCISIVKQQLAGRSRPTYRLRLDLMQNDFRSLAIYVERVGVPAKVRPVKPHPSQNRQVWRVSYDGPQAYAAIRNLRPFLERKRREAEVAMDFVEKGRIGLHPGPKGTPNRLWKIREACFRKLRKLK